MPERWRKITGYPGYEASDHCRVRSVERTLTDGRTAAATVLTAADDKDGYERVKLGRKLVPVHICVLLAWHGKPEGRHLNGDQHDNRPGNLAWGVTGTTRGTRGEERMGDKEEKRGMELGLVPSTPGCYICYQTGGRGMSGLAVAAIAVTLAVIGRTWQGPTRAPKIGSGPCLHSPG